MHGRTQGIEVSAEWKATRRWTLNPGYTFLKMHLRPDLNAQDTISAPQTEGSNPRHQAQLRSSIDLGRGFSWDASLYFVGQLPAHDISSYTRLDSQLRWRLGERLELAFVGQNLLHDHHAESNDIFTVVNGSQVKRGVYARITWRF
jgi:iron complex outermembrane receptor protein